MSQKLVDALANMHEDEAMSTVEEMLESGTSAKEILEDTRKAMDIVGERYEQGEYFLPELVMAGEMLNEITALVKPELAEEVEEDERHGRVLIGTVEGDIHDIGKNIVTFMLDVNGFEVRDLGIDVTPDKFIAAIEDFKPHVVGLSGFLTLAYDSMKATVEAIEAAGLRDEVKIMIGGGQVNDKIAEYAGADAYGDDAMAAINLSKKWIGV